jgi:hypothetical protein
MPTQRQRRKRRRRLADGGRSPGSARPIASATRGSESLSARRGPDGRPPAPWGSAPLSEIVIFIGILLLIGGFFVGPPQGFVMLAVGLGLASLAGLELAVREHYAGYRSHNLVLSAAVGVPVFGALLLGTKLPTAVCVAAGLVAFGGAAWLFASAFRRRSGGALYRLRG